MTNKEKCFQYLTETVALSRAVAIGIMANIRHESNFVPTAKGDSGTSYGLCQWHKSRWTRLKEYCADNGYNIAQVETQLRFMIWEFNNFYQKHWLAMAEEPNTKEGAANVAYTMCVKYEIPANKEQSGKKRMETARSLWDEFSTTEIEIGGNVEKPAPVVDKKTYRVKSGDTLERIAKRHGTTVLNIMAANPQRWNPNLIYVGEVLNIPGDD